MSEQALVDCSWGYGNNGCDGGESERAYQWIIDNGCIPSEESYNGGLYLMEVCYAQYFSHYTYIMYTYIYVFFLNFVTTVTRYFIA